jgi:hypothetical protein
MDLGRVGIWTFQLDLQPASAARDSAAELEALGYRTVWVPEAVGREPFVNSALLLSATEGLRVATGIASVWARDAMTMAAGQLTLSEAFPGRFLLGLGVSHQPMVDLVRGHHYERPLAKMRTYLDAMDGALYMAPRPAEEPRRVLAALGPRMLELAAARALGAHSYFVPVEHTAAAREVTWGCRTTRTTSAGSVGPTPTSPTAGPTSSSTPSSRGATSRPWSTGSARTSTRGPTTCACRCSTAARRPCRCPSGGPSRPRSARSPDR